MTYRKEERERQGKRRKTSEKGRMKERKSGREKDNERKRERELMPEPTRTDVVVDVTLPLVDKVPRRRLHV